MNAKVSEYHRWWLVVGGLFARLVGLAKVSERNRKCKVRSVLPVVDVQSDGLVCAR